MAQDHPAPAADEGDLRNQTFLWKLSFEGEKTLQALRQALLAGRLEASLAAARELVAGADARALVRLDERLFASPREALTVLFRRAPAAWRESADASIPATPAAALALRRAGDLHLEAGEFLAAAACYRRAGSHRSPGDEAGTAGLVLREALAALRLESISASRELLAAPALERALASVRLGGRRLKLANLAAMVPVGPRDPRALGPLSRFELSWSATLDRDPVRHRRRATREPSARAASALRSDLRAALLDGSILVQDRRYLYRFELASGRRRARIDLDRVLGCSRATRARASSAALRRAPATAGTLVVLAHGDEQLNAPQMWLAAFDTKPPAGSGGGASPTLAWKRHSNLLSSPALEGRTSSVRTDASLRPGARFFSAAPTIAGGRVYAVCRTALAPRIRVEAWCLDLASGRRIWSRELCEGAPITRAGTRLVRRSGGALPVAPALYADGVVYVCTNLGLFLALDALDGEVIYALRYARSERAGPRWQCATLQRTNQGIFFAPLDSDFFYGLRAGSRPLPARSADLFLFPPLPRGHLEAYLGGVRNRHYFYLRAPRWREVSELRLDSRGRPEGWLNSGDAGSQEEQMMFRPVITPTALFLASDRYLYTFDLSREFLATQRARTPRSPGTGIPLATGQCFGNLAAARSGLVSVGPLGVSFWKIRP